MHLINLVNFAVEFAPVSARTDVPLAIEKASRPGPFNQVLDIRFGMASSDCLPPVVPQLAPDIGRAFLLAADKRF